LTRRPFIDAAQVIAAGLQVTIPHTADKKRRETPALQTLRDLAAASAFQWLNGILLNCTAMAKLCAWTLKPFARLWRTFPQKATRLSKC
jgi:hypothetical protein